MEWVVFGILNTKERTKYFFVLHILSWKILIWFIFSNNPVLYFVKVVKVRYQNVWLRRLFTVSVGKLEVMTSCDNESDLISSSHIIIWVLHTRSVSYRVISNNNTTHWDLSIANNLALIFLNRNISISDRQSTV